MDLGSQRWISNRPGARLRARRALRSRVRRFESCRGTLYGVPKDPVSSGNAETVVFAYVRVDAARNGRMSRSVDEAWTGSWPIAVGH